MEDLDVAGAFWLEDKQDDKIPGHLTFNTKDGATLQLYGSFHDDGPFSSSGEAIRIHGYAGGKTLTLEHSLRIHQQIEIPGTERERYHPSIILSGAHTTGQQMLGFEAVRCRLRHLEHWVGRTGINTDPPSMLASREAGQFTITYSRPDREVVRTESGELDLEFPYTGRSDLFEARIEQGCRLEMRFPTPSDLQAAYDFCTALQNIVRLGVDSPAPIASVTLLHPDVVRPLTGRGLVDVPIQVYARWGGNHAEGKSRVIYPAQMLFTFDDIGGLAGVARWLGISEKYRLVIRRLVSHWYLPEVDSESRFFDSVLAAEVLAKTRSSLEGLGLQQWLAQIATHAGPGANALVGDVESWATEIRCIRNAMAHGDFDGDTDANRLYWLSESLYLLVVISLLREGGVPADALSGLQQHQRFTRAARGLAETRRPDPVALVESPE